MELLDVGLAQVTSAVAHISEIVCPPYQTVSVKNFVFLFQICLWFVEKRYLKRRIWASNSILKDLIEV